EKIMEVLHSLVQPTPLIPKFSGEVEELKDFMDKFELYSNAYKWGDERKSQYFPLYLSAYAMDTYRTMSKEMKSNYQLMIKNFREALETTESSKLFACRLRQRKQHQNETAKMFASQLICEVTQAYPELTEIQLQPILYDHFLNGLHPQLRVKVVENDTRNFHEAVKV